MNQEPSDQSSRPSALQKWLPRLIIMAVLINVAPSLILGNSIDPTSVEWARNAANIVYIAFFVIIVSKTIKDRNTKK